MPRPSLRIASGQGFWGDLLQAPKAQVDGGPIDFGHHMAEEAPEARATALLDFWRSVEERGGRAEPV